MKNIDNLSSFYSNTCSTGDTKIENQVLKGAIINQTCKFSHCPAFLYVNSNRCNRHVALMIVEALHFSTPWVAQMEYVLL